VSPDPKLPGLSPAQAQWLRGRYREKAAAIAREDPYRLAREVPGVGFKTADAIALQLGLPMDSERRIRAGVLFSLRGSADDGNVCLPFHRLVREAQAILEVDRRLVASVIEAMGSDGELAIEAPPAGQERDRDVYLPELRLAEEGVAAGLLDLAGSEGLLSAEDAESAISASGPGLGISLAPAQVEALRASLTHGLAVVTGGPGTGKTTVLKGLLSTCSARGLRVAFAAPTGRAARRMADATGREAKTIHRMLEYAPGAGGFRRNRGYPLDCDLLVIDEASMVDTPLMHHLLQALPGGRGAYRRGDAQGQAGGPSRGSSQGQARGTPGSALLLVGDADQLPSVGPGQVFRDLISSGVAPVVRLTEAFRQAAESDIVAAAHRILQGLPPEEPRSRGQGDFQFVEEADPARAARIIVDLVQDRIPRRLSVDPLEGIQVLAPMHRGVAGSTALNLALQSSLNPQGAALSSSDQLFGPAWRALKLGDKVMQRRNNYDKGVFNGDVGRILGPRAAASGAQAAKGQAGADRGGQGAQTRVSFDEEEVLYETEELGQLSLAYALSVHKAQGSEYPAVVLALLDEHAAMLERNLLYTAVTRARRLMVIVGSRAALHSATRRAGSRIRCTGLVQRLTSAAGPR